MKRLFSIVLVCVLLFSACSSPSINSSTVDSESKIAEPSNDSLEDNAAATEIVSPSSETMNAQDEQLLTEDDNLEETDSAVENPASDSVESLPLSEEGNIDFTIKGMDDEVLLRYVEDNIYSSLIPLLNSEDYFIENIEAVYFPKEYIEAMASNSQHNLYFGFTSEELNTYFSGTKYVFTLGEDGLTTVVPMETVSDDVYVKAMEDVIIGAGVILICVTVSLVAAPAAPAIGMIFAASASTGLAFALESSAISFAAAAIAKGYETESFDQALKAGVAAAGEGFKWGAISGAIIGGVGEGLSLYGAAKQTNFTMNQYAKIQQETGYPLDVIKEFHTMKEYEAFRDANLKPAMVGNKSALIKTDIDLTKVDSKGRTNLERMRQGLAPQDSQGISYELHHIGQKQDGTLAILTQSEHDNPAIHGFLERTEAHAAGTNWDAERQAFWKAFAKMVGKIGG